VEVITSVQRRRRWTPEEKIRIVEEHIFRATRYRLWHVSTALLATSCSPGAG
jgi:transposase-like protein